MEFGKIVLEHARRYPLMQPRDYVKLAYQHALGCGHMVKDGESCLMRIRAERKNGETGVRTERIGNGLARLYLDGGETEISDAAAANMFMHTANTFSPRENAMEIALETLLSLSKKDLLSVTHKDMQAFIENYKSASMPLVSHTDAYKAAYAPAYRVINEDFVRVLPVVSALEKLSSEKGNILVAIDGMCASGKTTLSSLLSVCLDAPVFLMDAFSQPPEKRTPERLNEPGGNVDYERFYEEVLLPLKSGKPFSFRPFDCSKMALSETEIRSQAGKITLIEGAYACHPLLMSFYDYIIVMTIDGGLQKERILKRNGEYMLTRFINEWIPMELRYLEHFGIPEKADLVLEAKA